MHIRLTASVLLEECQRLSINILQKTFRIVQQEQQKILDSYFDDISKYASNTEKPKVKNCYLSVPKQLAKENKKFQFSVVEKKRLLESMKTVLNGSEMPILYIYATMSIYLNFLLQLMKKKNSTSCIFQI